MKTGLLAAVAMAAAWWLMRPSAGAVQYAENEPPQDTGADDIELPNIFNQVQDMIAPTDEDRAAANVAAFLLMIRKAEGTADALGYSALFGHKASRPHTFSGWADHPRIAQRYGSLWTSAAGAYQFMAVSPLPSGGSTKVNTWDRIAKRLGLPDFSPASQDLAAIELIREAGALGDVRAGRFDQAVDRVRRIWASMPGAGYSQPEKSLDALRLAYLNAGGTLA